MDDLVEKTKNITIKEKDEDFFGLQGLRPNTVLYRVCRYDENTKKDIECQDKDSKRSVNQHINSGSKNPSRFISTTTSEDGALAWAYYTKEEPKKVVERPEGPQPIIKIDLAKMEGMKELDTLINLKNEEVRKHFVSGATQINRVKSSKEVLFQLSIPKKNSKDETVFELWKDPPKPSKP